MLLIYCQESDIEASFFTAIYAFYFQKNNSINDLFNIDYLPLKISISLLDFLANKRQININLYQDILINHDYSFYNLSLDEGAIALFSLFLYFYGDNHSLERELDDIKVNYLPSNININSWKILIIVINLILDNKIKETNILKQITDNLQKYQAEEIKEIKIIDELITNKIYLTQAEEILRENIDKNSLGIYQSIYNFFCLPHNSEITLHRSQKFSNSQEVTRILTGFLVGLNSGYSAIPPLRDIKYQGKAIDKIIKQFIAQWQGKLSQYSDSI